MGFPTIKRAAAIVALNRSSLNQAAAELLPTDWRDGPSLSVLALAMWGAENGVSVELPGARVSDDDVREELHMLIDGDPAEAMATIEGATSSGEVSLQPSDLEGLDREQGAFLILEAIRDALTMRDRAF